MGESVNLQSRRALLKQFAPQYREASYAQKRVLLDVFAKATGYHRRYGMWLLNHAEDVLHAPAYKRSNHYGPEVQYALFPFPILGIDTDNGGEFINEVLIAYCEQE